MVSLKTYFQISFKMANLTVHLVGCSDSSLRSGGFEPLQRGEINVGVLKLELSSLHLISELRASVKNNLEVSASEFFLREPLRK